MSEIAGYEMFEEVEDYILRRRNQTQVAANIVIEGLYKREDGKLSVRNKNVRDLITYLTHLPEDDKAIVAAQLRTKVEADIG